MLFQRGSCSRISSWISAISSWRNSSRLSSRRIRNPSRTPRRVHVTRTRRTAVFQSVRRTRRVPRSTLILPYDIPSSPHGLNDRLLEAAIELTAYPRHVNLDHVGRSLPVRLPEMLAQHPPCDNLPGMSHEKLKKAKLGWGQVDFAFATNHSSRREIKSQFTHPEDRRGTRRHSSAESFKPGQQLRESKGFHKVIVGARFETGNAFLHRSERTEEQYGRSDTFAANGTQDIHTVAFRKQNVEYNGIELLRADEFKPALPVFDPRTLVASFLQPPQQGAANHGVIFHNEELHEFGSKNTTTAVKSEDRISAQKRRTELILPHFIRSQLITGAC